MIVSAEYIRYTLYYVLTSRVTVDERRSLSYRELDTKSVCLRIRYIG